VQFITDVQQKVARFTAENATTLLTAGGVVGTVATGVLAARGGLKYSQIIRAKQDEILEGIDPIASGAEEIAIPTNEKLRIAVINFAPPVLIGGATIASIIMAHRMSGAKIAAMAAAYGLAERNLSEYKEKVAEKLTGPKAQQIDDEVAQDRVSRTPGHETIIIGDGNVLCFDACTGRYFQSTVEQIRAAMNSTNAEILNHDYVRASYFYEELGLKPTTWTDETGWNRDHLPELKITSGMTEDKKPYISIDFTILPKVDYVPKHY